MAGSRALRKIQLGLETTAGSIVNATTIWRGMGVIHDQREVVFPAEDVGILGGTDRSYVSRYWSELTLDSVEATFEQIGYQLEAGVKSVTTAGSDTGGDGYIYEYAAPVTSQNTTKTYTFEGGDDQQEEEAAYWFCKHFNLSGDGQGALFMTSDWFGRVTADGSYTTGQNIPDVEEILVNKGTLCIDNSGGTIGLTPVSDTLFGIDFDWTTGLQEYWALDGSLDFSLTKFTEDEIILNLVYEHNSNAVTEKGKYRDNSTRLIRLKFEGSQFTTSGDYTYKTLIIDVAGVYEDWSVLQDQDGNDVVTATLRVRYSGTDTLKAEVVVVNALSTMA
jgi:hypothetical protein